jgi:hypothetical protein
MAMTIIYVVFVVNVVVHQTLRLIIRRPIGQAGAFVSCP